MDATAKIRAMLDERGIHWWAGESENQTRWESRGLTWEFEEGVGLTFLGVCENDVTPEQAIAATVGAGTIEKEAERIHRIGIEVLSGFAREYLHRYGMLMSMAGEDVTDEVMAMESVINEVLRKAVSE